MLTQSRYSIFRFNRSITVSDNDATSSVSLFKLKVRLHSFQIFPPAHIQLNLSTAARMSRDGKREFPMD